MTERRIGASAVRQMCGGVSDMTLWRWLNDPRLAFPQPIRIAKRRYWREADVIAWLDAQAVALPEGRTERLLAEPAPVAG